MQQRHIPVTPAFHPQLQWMPSRARPYNGDQAGRGASAIALGNSELAVTCCTLVFEVIGSLDSGSERGPLMLGVFLRGSAGFLWYGLRGGRIVYIENLNASTVQKPSPKIPKLLSVN